LRLPKGFESYLKLLVYNVGEICVVARFARPRAFCDETDIVCLPQEVGREAVTQGKQVTLQRLRWEQQPTPPGNGRTVLAISGA